MELAKDRLNTLNWLSPERFSDVYDAFQSRRAENTGTWFLESLEFQTWVTGATNLLVVPGMGASPFGTRADIDVKLGLGNRS